MIFSVKRIMRVYNWACLSAQQGSEKAVKAIFHKMRAEVWGTLGCRLA
jgi:HEPN domain-containing protein